MRPDAVRRQAAQGAGAGRPLLRRHQAPRGGFHARAGRGAVEAGRVLQDRAQRGGSRPARERPRLLQRQHRLRPQPADHGAAENRGRAARSGVPAPRKALCRGQRQRQARQLVFADRHWRESAEARQDSQPERPVPAVSGGLYQGRGRVSGHAALLRGLPRQRPPSGRQRGSSRHRVRVSGRRADRHSGLHHSGHGVRGHDQTPPRDRRGHPAGDPPGHHRPEPYLSPGLYR